MGKPPVASRGPSSLWRRHTGWRSPATVQVLVDGAYFTPLPECLPGFLRTLAEAGGGVTAAAVPMTTVARVANTTSRIDVPVKPATPKVPNPLANAVRTVRSVRSHQ